MDFKYKSTENVMTERQWLEKGYLLKENAEGIEGWNNRFCIFRVIRYTKDEVYQDETAARARIKEIRHEAYLKKKKQEEAEKHIPSGGLIASVINERK